VEQEMFTLLEYLSSPLFLWVLVAQCLVVCVVVCRSLFFFLSLLIWLLYCLSFYCIVCPSIVLSVLHLLYCLSFHCLVCPSIVLSVLLLYCLSFFYCIVCPSIVLSVLLLYCLSFYCIVCPSSIYGFWMVSSKWIEVKSLDIYKRTDR
jgi:hypothetical protein